MGFVVDGESDVVYGRVLCPLGPWPALVSQHVAFSTSLSGLDELRRCGKCSSAVRPAPTRPRWPGRESGWAVRAGDGAVSRLRAAAGCRGPRARRVLLARKPRRQGAKRLRGSRELYPPPINLSRLRDRYDQRTVEYIGDKVPT